MSLADTVTASAITISDDRVVDVIIVAAADAAAAEDDDFCTMYNITDGNRVRTEKV